MLQPSVFNCGNNITL